MKEETQLHTRTPSAHPEGYLEAFANIYRNVALAIQARLAGQQPDPRLDFPTIEDGVHGMAFIETVVESSRRKTWMKMVD
ncbi:MAG: hypothetical protein HC842_02080 [Cytophagales bacterium]|nr:hypothetical protein [Cytophagales bacterium]